MVKALVGLVSPLSPSVSQEDPGFSNEFYDLVKKQGYSKAIDTFIAEHGSNAVSYTVAHTDAATQGASLPYTQKAMDWIDSNNGLVTGPYATGAAFLVPQDPTGGDVQKISNELLKMNLRARRTPQDFMNAIYIAAGNSAQFADKKTYDAMLKTVGNNSQMQQVLQTAWSQHTASMAFWNPVWYNDYASPIRSNTAKLAYADLQQIFAKGLAPDDQQSADVMSLMEAYEAYQVHSAAVGNSRTASADSDRKGLQNAWSGFLDKQMNTNPNLAPVIRAVFSRLPDTNAAIGSLNAGTASLTSL
jgi:hypothetical protein